MYIQHQLQVFSPSSYVMKFEQTRISLSYLNTETNQQWCRHHGLLPSPLLSGWGHFEKTKFSTICGDTRRYIRISWIGRGASVWHVLPVMDDRLTKILYSLWWMRSLLKSVFHLVRDQGKLRPGQGVDVHSSHTLATWVKDEGLCCSRTMPVLMLPEECKKEKKKKERKNTQTPTPLG